MNKGLRLMSVAGLGAGLMYLFDPDRGKRRRALVRNKITHASKSSQLMSPAKQAGMFAIMCWAFLLK